MIAKPEPLDVYHWQRFNEQTGRYEIGRSIGGFSRDTDPPVCSFATEDDAIAFCRWKNGTSQSAHHTIGQPYTVVSVNTGAGRSYSVHGNGEDEPYCIARDLSQRAAIALCRHKNAQAEAELWAAEPLDYDPNIEETCRE